jgi:hypothetical protein
VGVKQSKAITKMMRRKK